MEGQALVPFEKMTSSLVHLSDAKEVQLAYIESATVVDFLLHRGRIEGMRRYLEGLSTAEESPGRSAVFRDAFGMGMDIPDIHWVVHLSPPAYLEDYLQEVGRVGRGVIERERAGLESLSAMMLFSPVDFENMRSLRATNELGVPQIRDIEAEFAHLRHAPFRMLHAAILPKRESRLPGTAPEPLIVSHSSALQPLGRRTRMCERFARKHHPRGSLCGVGHKTTRELQLHLAQFGRDTIAVRVALQRSEGCAKIASRTSV